MGVSLSFNFESLDYLFQYNKKNKLKNTRFGGGIKPNLTPEIKSKVTDSIKQIVID